jgi:hypothetical protein
MEGIMTARELLRALLRDWGAAKGEGGLPGSDSDSDGALELTYAGRIPLLLEAADEGDAPWLRLSAVLLPLPEEDILVPFMLNLLRYNQPGNLPPGVSLGLDDLDTLLIAQRPLAGLDAGLLRGLTASFAELADALQQELRAFAADLSGFSESSGQAQGAPESPFSAENPNLSGLLRI